MILEMLEFCGCLLPNVEVVANFLTFGADGVATGVQVDPGSVS